MDTQSPRRYSVAVLSRGDAEARRNTTPQNSRFVRVFEALAAVGIEAQPAIYDETFADAVREQLRGVDGVLVWVDPIHQGKTRAELDALLRDVAAHGPWVSAHPDVILKMGVKEVLYRTRHLGWGGDTHRYDSAVAFRAEFPQRLRAGGPRVLKQNRGNGGTVVQPSLRDVGRMRLRGEDRAGWRQGRRHGGRGGCCRCGLHGVLCAALHFAGCRARQRGQPDRRARPRARADDDAVDCGRARRPGAGSCGGRGRRG